MNNIFRGDTATRQVPLMQLTFKKQKAAEITQLDAHKQQRRYLITYRRIEVRRMIRLIF